jgi:hypothetical protein
MIGANVGNAVTWPHRPFMHKPRGNTLRPASEFAVREVFARKTHGALFRLRLQVLREIFV